MNKGYNIGGAALRRGFFKIFAPAGRGILPKSGEKGGQIF